MNAFAELIFTTLVRGTWLMTVALVVVYLVRGRAPLAASALLRGTIIALLLMPALIAAMPSVRVPLLSAVVTQTESLPRPETPIPSVEVPIVPSPVDSGMPAIDVDSSSSIDSTSTVNADAPTRPAAATPAPQPSQFPWSSLLLGIYLAGAMFFALRMLIGLCLVRRLRVGVAVCDASWQQSLRQCRERLNVVSDVQLTSNSSVSVPMTIGWRRPVILLPESSLAASPIDREAVLLHELAHIRRRDCFWLVLLRLVEVAYWCHPLLWLMGRADRQLREQACDDVCVHWLGSGERYRDALLGIAKRITTRPQLAVGLAMAGGSNLSRRVTHILQSTGNSRCLPGRSTRMTIAGSLLLVAPLVGLVQLVPRASQAMAADDLPANDTTVATTVTFKVTDADGTPVPAGEAHVRGSTRRGEFFEHRLEITDGTVDVPLPSSQLESMTIVVGAPGCLTYYKQFVRVVGEAAYVALPEYEFPLRRGQHIGGRLVNEAGEPVAGAELYLYAPSGGEIEQGFDGFELRVTTDDDGRWETTRAAADLTNLHIKITHDHYVARSESAQVVSEDHKQLRNLTDVRTLEAAPTLSGTVIDPDGRPVAGAMMLIDSTDNIFMDYDKGLIPTTDENGEFAFSNVPLGEQRLTVFSPDWALEMVTVTVPLQEPLQITMHKGSRVEFRAVDTNGDPIEGIGFHPEGPYYLDLLSNRNLLNNTTNAEGIFVWENAPAEPLSYQIYGPDYLSMSGVQFGPEGSPHTIVFESWIPVDLNVVDAATDEELTAYSLFRGVHFKGNPPDLWEWSQEPPQEVRRVVDGGSLALMSVDRLVQFRVQAAGYLPAESAVLDATEFVGDRVEVEIRLERNAEYAVRVLRPDGVPAAGAKVYGFTGQGSDDFINITNGVPDEGSVAFSVDCGADGRFTLPPMDDPFICFIADEAGYLEVADVGLLDADDITLLPWARVEGEVQLNGEVAAGLTVNSTVTHLAILSSGELTPEISHINYGVTDAAGRFTFPQCLAGARSLSVYYDTDPPPGQFGNSEHRRFELAAGATSIQDFGRDAVDIVGQVVVEDLSEVDWSRSALQLMPTADAPEAGADPSQSEQVHYESRLDESGAFRIRNVTPGDGNVYVGIWIKGESRWSHGLAIPITPEMFEGKSAINPIDLGEISIDDGAE